MPKLLQINSVANTGSTGHITEDIGIVAIANGWESYIAYGRKALPSKSHLIRVGNRFDVLWHVFVTRFFDLHGLASIRSTKKFIKQIKKIKPDIIHLHNIHGYYLNYKILFQYLSKCGKPIVWTMHDCWSFTGHCAYYTYKKCNKWNQEKNCKKCAYKKTYPHAILFSNSYYNYIVKKKYFNLIDTKLLTIVTPSIWLRDEISKSFLQKYNRLVINNGIDLNVFKPIDNNTKDLSKRIILGVASVWDERKGLKDCIELAQSLSEDEEIILVGLNDNQIASLPKDKRIYGIGRTENQSELVELYSKSVVFINPTYEDNFPTTNLEALACGIPVITYRTGGSVEAIDDETGFIVEPGNISSIRDCVTKIEIAGKDRYKKACRERAEKLYNKTQCFKSYLDLYNSILSNR